MNSEYTCAQCRDALPGYIAGTLARTVRPLVERHLAVCDACQHEYTQWRTLANLAHQADAQTPKASTQSATGTWAAIEARILTESPITTGVHSVNDSRHDASPTQGTAPIASPPSTHPSLVRRRVPLGVPATVAAVLLVAFAVGLFAFHGRVGGTTAGSGGQPGTTPPTATGGAHIVYSASAMLSPTDAWAVGTNSQNSGVISHFDGKAWHIDQSNIFSDSSLSGIAMDSATDGWVVGTHVVNHKTGAQVPFLAHYTQGRWVSQTLNLPNASLQQVQLFGPDAGWAMGSDGNSTLFLHFQHGVWAPTTFAPTPAASTQAAAATHTVSPLAYHVPLLPLSAGPQVRVEYAQFLSDTEGWATGHDQTGLAVWHYLNGQWQTALHLAAAPEAEVLGLGANSSTDVWVLGTAGVGQAFASAKLAYHPLSTRSSGGPLVLLHFDGHAWASRQADSSAGQPFLGGASWLTKYGVVKQQQVLVGLLMNQGGHWSATTFPKPVTSVLSANTAPDGSTLVVAATGDATGSQMLQVLRYANGSWSKI